MMKAAFVLSQVDEELVAIELYVETDKGLKAFELRDDGVYHVELSPAIKTLQDVYDQYDSLYTHVSLSEIESEEAGIAMLGTPV